MALMRAAVMTERPARQLKVTSIERPEPQDGDDVVVAVEACGVCGTDLHILAGQAYKPELPFVLGHEIVGRVISAGADAGRASNQGLVAVWPFRGCGSCAMCTAGQGQLCPSSVSVTGVAGAFGGFAEYVRVRGDQLVPIPEGLSATCAAALVDAGTTALNAVEAAAVKEGALHVVVGGGPVGFCAAELLRARGCSVIIVERQERRRRIATENGFSVAASVDALVETPSVVVDCAGTGSTLQWAIDALGPHGSVAVVAYGVADRFDTTQISRKELTVRGVRSGTRDQLRSVLHLAAQGIVGNFPVREWELGGLTAALDGIRSGDDPTKPVIVSRG